MLAVLIIEDDEQFRREVRARVDALEPRPVSVAEAGDVAAACRCVDESPPDLVVTDCIMPMSAGARPNKGAGAAVLSHLAARCPGARALMLSGQDAQAAADLLVAHRISDYVSKETPWRVIQARMEQQYALACDERRRAVADAERSEDVALVAESPSMKALRARLEEVGPMTTSVLLTGESGVGKEVAARLLHRLSPRRLGPFVAVNCAVLLDDLSGSELFGHVRGAFTGAEQCRPGRFELASGGTLLLDEVAELSERNQAALLRVLEERTVQRMGDSRNIPVDVRVVAATNQDLREAVAVGRFRKDLFFRLAVYPILLPPLRERGPDIAPLAEHFLRRLRTRMKRPASSFEPEALAVLAAYPWPGNVRELANVVERALIAEQTPAIRAATVRAYLDPISTAEHAAEPVEYEGARRAFERRFWEHVLACAKGSIAEAGRLAGLPRATIYDKLRACGLRDDERPKGEDPPQG